MNYGREDLINQAKSLGLKEHIEKIVKVVKERKAAAKPKRIRLNKRVAWPHPDLGVLREQLAAATQLGDEIMTDLITEQLAYFENVRA